MSDNATGKIKCAHCENIIDVENAEYKMDIGANYVCDECANKAVIIRSVKTEVYPEHYYTYERRTDDKNALRGIEDHSTGYYRSKEPARQRAIAQSKKLYGEDVVIIEE